jgi:hypothetical protein
LGQRARTARWSFTINWRKNHWPDFTKAIILGDRYWVCPAFSAPYDRQLHFDAFSSPDLIHWIQHERILDNREIRWAKRAIWAPAAVERQGKYYLFFGANDVHEGGIGGIGVAVADRPAGPFKDLLDGV